MNHNRFLDYTKDENDKLIINPEQAIVVKRIYREYLEGASLVQIARGLEADEILTAAKRTKWRPGSIKKILQNEKYIGDALLQKTYTVDFLTKKRVVNNGHVPQYYVENNHEAIIPREIYLQVQEEMMRRANIRNGKQERNVCIAADMHCRVLSFAKNVKMFFEGFTGITEGAGPLYGDVLAG